MIIDNSITYNEIVKKIKMREYEFLEEYFNSNYSNNISETQYDGILTWFILTNISENFTKVELVYIKNILLIMSKKFNFNDPKNNEKKLKILKRNLGIRNNSSFILE